MQRAFPGPPCRPREPIPGHVISKRCSRWSGSFWMSRSRKRRAMRALALRSALEALYSAVGSSLFPNALPLVTSDDGSKMRIEAGFDSVGFELGGRHLGEVIRAAPTPLEPRSAERTSRVDHRLPSPTQPDQQATWRMPTGNRMPGDVSRLGHLSTAPTKVAGGIVLQRQCGPGRYGDRPPAGLTRTWVPRPGPTVAPFSAHDNWDRGGTDPSNPSRWREPDCDPRRAATLAT